ncbi:MAG: hypothetical protein HQK83_06315 [Fibrobacteria bacterium]|nr:hypothetical protein [Fibrobacteria bacterium]
MKTLTLLLISVLYLMICSCSSTCNTFKYVKTQENIPSGKTENLSEEELAIENTITKVTEIPECANYFKDYFHTAYIIPENFDNLAFTVEYKSDKFTLTRGIDPSKQPDLVIPMTSENITNLLGICSDGKITPEEEYSIIYVTFIPSYKSLLKVEDMFNPYVAKKLNLPNFMQITLKNPNNFKYHGSTKELSATVVNVDGQWLVFEGLMGDPDMRMEVTQEHAAEFAKASLDPAKKNNLTMAEKQAKLKKIQEMIDKVIVYRRPQ